MADNLRRATGSRPTRSGPARRDAVRPAAPAEFARPLTINLDAATWGALRRAARAANRPPAEEAERLIACALDEPGHMAAPAQLLGGPTTYGIAMILGRVMHEIGAAAHEAIVQAPPSRAPAGPMNETAAPTPMPTPTNESAGTPTGSSIGAGGGTGEAWIADPVAFDQAVKVVHAVLDALRPPGEVTAPTVGDGPETLDLNALFVDLRERFAATTLFAVAEPGGTSDDGLRAWGRRVAEMLTRGAVARAGEPPTRRPASQPADEAR